jgi:hypothetical protein
MQSESQIDSFITDLVCLPHEHKAIYVTNEICPKKYSRKTSLRMKLHHLGYHRDLLSLVPAGWHSLHNFLDMKTVLIAFLILGMFNFANAGELRFFHHQRVMKLNSEPNRDVLGSEVLVDAEFISRYNEFRHCFDKALRHESIFLETLSFQVTINDLGIILNAQAQPRDSRELTQGRQVLVECATRRILNIRVQGALPGQYLVNLDFGK